MKRWYLLAAMGVLASLGLARGERYKYQSYKSIVDQLLAWEATYPHYVEVWNAQDKYGLPTAGTCRSAKEPCKHWFIRVTNEATLREEPSRPQVFFSGNLHGNEVVGPPTLMASLALMLEAAAKVNPDPTKAAGMGPTKGPPDSPEVPPTAFDSTQWLARLVDTRVTVAMVVSNPIGYENRVREELGIDPNRDFAHDVAPNKCMQTVVARAVNEAFRAHIFQSSITFHGGMQAVTYQWGAFPHRGQKDRSPDETVLAALSHTMADWAGGFPTSKYEVSQMNNMVYPVHGGMEDWAYAGSWDKGHLVQCTPATHGGYPASRTAYADATLRCAMVLIETSDAKRPAEGLLGSPTQVLQHEGQGNGHVPRNLRATLATIDTVEPYVHPLSMWGASVRGEKADGSPYVVPPANLAFFETRAQPGLSPGEQDAMVRYTAQQGTLAAFVDQSAGEVIKLNLAYDVGGGWNVAGSGVFLVHAPTQNMLDILTNGARGLGAPSTGTGAGWNSVGGAPILPEALTLTPVEREWLQFMQGTRTERGLAADGVVSATGDRVLGAEAAALIKGSVRAPLGPGAPGGAGSPHSLPTRWGRVNGRPEVEAPLNMAEAAYKTRFNLTVTAPNPVVDRPFCMALTYVAVPWAVVDPDARLQRSDVEPAMPPQTHLARTRGNGAYYASVAVPAADAEDGEDVVWEVRGQYQAVGAGLGTVWATGGPGECYLETFPGVWPTGEGRAPPSPSPAPQGGPAPSPSPTHPPVGLAPTTPPGPDETPPTPLPVPAEGGDDESPASTASYGLVVVGALTVLGLVGAGVAVWRRGAVRRRYAQAAAAVSAPPRQTPTSFSDGARAPTVPGHASLRGADGGGRLDDEAVMGEGVGVGVTALSADSAPAHGSAGATLQGEDEEDLDLDDVASLLQAEEARRG